MYNVRKRTSHRFFMFTILRQSTSTSSIDRNRLSCIAMHKNITLVTRNRFHCTFVVIVHRLSFAEIRNDASVTDNDTAKLQSSFSEAIKTSMPEEQRNLTRNERERRRVNSKWLRFDVCKTCTYMCRVYLDVYSVLGKRNRKADWTYSSIREIRTFSVAAKCAVWFARQHNSNVAICY